MKRNVRDVGWGAAILIVISCFGIYLMPAANAFNPKDFSKFIPPGAPVPQFNYSAGVWENFKNLMNAHRGDTMKGMADLKQYFQQFGYLSDPQGENMTEAFDDLVESAIKMYQQNFGLNVTGDLDTDTVSQIMMPRCGMGDVINGTSTMLRNNSRLPTTTSLHAVKHYTFFPGSPRWSAYKRDLTYAFSPTNEVSEISLTDMRNVFSRAFQRWAAVIPLTFAETEDYESADLKVGFFSGDHGDGEPFDGVLGTLAHAFSPEDGRFHLDAAESWTVDVNDDSVSTAIDLESIATHEIGHLLGLGHTSVRDAVMYPSIAPKTRRVDLAQDDILGVQQLYGSNPNYDPNAVSSTVSSPDHQSDTSAAPSLSPLSLLSCPLTLVFPYLLLNFYYYF